MTTKADSSLNHKYYFNYWFVLQKTSVLECDGQVYALTSIKTYGELLPPLFLFYFYTTIWASVPFIFFSCISPFPGFRYPVLSSSLLQFTNGTSSVETTSYLLLCFNIYLVLITFKLTHMVNTLIWINTSLEMKQKHLKPHFYSSYVQPLLNYKSCVWSYRLVYDHVQKGKQFWTDF